MPAFVPSSELSNLVFSPNVFPYVQLFLLLLYRFRQILCLQEEDLASSFSECLMVASWECLFPFSLLWWDGFLYSPSFWWEEEDFQDEFNLLRSNLLSVYFPYCTILVSMFFLSFLSHFTPLPYLSLISSNVIKMSTDRSAPNCYCLKSSSPLVCASYTVMRWVHEAIATPNVTCFSFSQSLKFPCLKPFHWFKKFLSPRHL